MKTKGQGTTGVVLIIVFVIILLVALVIYGSYKATGESPQRAFRGGTEGVRLSILDVPAQINQGQAFDIVVLAENKGEHRIPARSISAVMSNYQSFNILDGMKTNDIALDPGDATEIVYENARFTAPVLSEDIPQSFSIGICYPYETMTKVNEVCLAPSKTDTLCKSAGEKESENWGAPIMLSSFKQLASVYNTGQEYIDLNVKLEFKQTGSGNIYSPDAKCNALAPSDANKIKIKSIILGVDSFDEQEIKLMCGSNIIQLSNRDGKTQGSLRCTLRQRGIRTDLMTPLTIITEYIHEQQLSESIRVMPVM